MTQDEMKMAAAKEAIKLVPDNQIIGVGTGSTVNFFIDCLKDVRDRIKGAVTTSDESQKRLEAAGIEVVPLSEVISLPVYFDGADEVSTNLQMIKGGGGALLREKVVASVSEKFICLADESKLVKKLGKFPLPVEVIKEARSKVARDLRKLGGDSELRIGFTTHYGNDILDVRNLDINEPIALEEEINKIVGVVENGLFAKRGADVLVLATANGVEVKTLKDM